MITDWALAYLAGAWTALLTTPTGWAVIAATLVLVAAADRWAETA